ncbi:MAG TPA: flagellar hook-associated protein FlgK [Bryobacteraceae bacterium]|nr:flagellar hook-associated protein FlgK [Bryobacteraceae bacterium]
MSNLLASLQTSGDALDVFQQALNVVQNDVNNSQTPGYARQRLALEAQPLVVTGGLAGGVAATGLQDSRDQFAEEQVQSQTQALGQYSAQAQATAAIQSFFDVSGTSGLPADLNALFQSFSAWSVTPSDPALQQNVISSASTLASSVNGLHNSLIQTSQQLDTQISSTLDQINNLAGQIQQYNVERQQQSQPDPGQDAQLHAALDSLSQLINFTTVTQGDGTVTVMLNGGAPLVVGDQQYQLIPQNYVDNNPPAANPDSPPTAHILEQPVPLAAGTVATDITSQVTGGQLGGLLDVRNRVLGSILGDAQQPGSLNQFASGLANAVNGILEKGKVSTDPNAASGTDLFTFNNSDATLAAGTLAVTGITPDQLAPVDASGTANGAANQLASLATATSGPGTIGGLSMVQYLAQISSAVGLENQAATANQQAQQQVVAQVTTLRNQVSGVSLDDEAVNVMEYQRAYQAAAQVISVLNSLADTTLAMMPPAA